MLNRSKQLFTAARRVSGTFTFYAVSCALMVVLAVGCSDGLVAPDAAQVEALSTADGTAAAAKGQVASAAAAYERAPLMEQVCTIC